MIKSETVESFARMHADPVTFEPPSPVAFMVAVIPGWGAGHHSCPPSSVSPTVVRVVICKHKADDVGW